MSDVDLKTRWLDTIVRSSTRSLYGHAFDRYLDFTEKKVEELVDEAIEDQRRDPRERRGLPLTRLLKFYEYLITKYPRYRRQLPRQIIGYGLSRNSALTYVNAVRSFYSTFEIFVKLKGRSNLPRGRVENKRLILDANQVRRLVNHARTIRDRAIILFLFQSGMDRSTLCSLQYRDVVKGLQKDEIPLVVDPSRVKTDVDYYTFLGRDGVDLLRAYLVDMRSRGVTFTSDHPLFLTERDKRPLRPQAIQEILRGVSIRAGFIQESDKYNIAGAHSLRESFSSILINDEVPDAIVDFLLGHRIGEMSKAYKSVQFDKVRRIYLEREPLLSIYPREEVESNE